MKKHNRIKPKKSLGILKRNKKTKPRSPDLVGHITLQKETLEEIIRQYKEAGKGEVPCNIAAWYNDDEDRGKHLSIELSPWFVPKQRKKPKGDIFDALLGDDDEEEQDDEDEDE